MASFTVRNQQSWPECFVVTPHPGHDGKLTGYELRHQPGREVTPLTGKGFWRTVQKAIERDNWTVRFIAILLTIGMMILVAAMAWRA
ncbi:hypothetical protein GCM10023083_41460 [Streptomyces phyllanthi]